MSDRTPSPAPADFSTTQTTSRSEYTTREEPKKPDTEIQVQEYEPIPFPSPTASVQAKEVEPISLPSPTASVKVKEVEPITLLFPTASVQAKEAESSSPSLSRTASVKADESYASFSLPVTRKTRSAVERRALLEDDPQVEEVEPHQALCRYCQKWIRLSLHSAYSGGNWEVHKLRCGEKPMLNGSLRRAPSKPALNPSSRVATAERRFVLLNDPQVREYSPRHVLCNTCRTVVVLEGEVDYSLVLWGEHKEKCIPRTPAPITTHERASRRAHVPFPTPPTSSTDSHISVGSPRSPTAMGEGKDSNTQSREATVTVEHSPAAVKAGVKRGREEEVEEVEEEAAEDARPRNRPRKETYEPPEGDASNVLGWFLLPFQNLTRGFREGVGFT